MDNRIYITYYNSYLGEITLASDGNSLIGLWFENQKYYLSNYQDVIIHNDLLVFKKVKLWLDNYFKGENPQITFSLKPKGTKFQNEVWETLKDIPYGEVISYGDVAKKLNTKGYQAIGNAISKNPISIIIPCHRVVAKDKKLTGYAGGIEKKQALLNLERVVSEEKNEK